MIAHHVLGHIAKDGGAVGGGGRELREAQVGSFDGGSTLEPAHAVAAEVCFGRAGEGSGGVLLLRGVGVVDVIARHRSGGALCLVGGVICPVARGERLGTIQQPHVAEQIILRGHVDDAIPLQINAA